MKELKKDNNHKIVLQILKEEYEKEKQTTSLLDNKSGIFLSAFALIMTMWMQIIPFDQIKIYYVEYEIGINHIVLGLLYVIPIVLILLTLFSLIKCFKIREYNCVNTDSVIENAQNTNISEDEFIIALITHYQEIIKMNSQLNNEKSIYLRRGLRLFFIYSVMAIISFVFIKIIII